MPRRRTRNDTLVAAQKKFVETRMQLAELELPRRDEFASDR